MAEIAKIEIDGLRQFQRNLKRVDADAPKALRKTLNEVADEVATLARQHVPRRSGRAAASLRAASTQTAARVRAGGSRVPYYGWLEFGGSVGRHGSVRRPRDKGGRYIWPAIAKERTRLEELLEAGLIELAGEIVGE